MLIKDGTNSKNEQYWKLCVPNEHCTSGLEVGIVATENGLEIGGELISWNELEKAKNNAQKHLPF